MTLTEFLLARIAEHEADLCAMSGLCPDGSEDPDWGQPDGYAVSNRMLDVATIGLRGCAATRQIVALHKDRHYCHLDGVPGIDAQPYDDDNCDTLMLLAAVYADRSEYREEWSPSVT